MKILISIVLFFLISCLAAQNFEDSVLLRIFKNKGEVYFKFQVPSTKYLNTITNIISIDERTKPESKTVFAYANKKQFKKFLELQYQYEILTSPGSLLLNPKMQSSISGKSLSWDSYPTYQVYLDQMQIFESSYPSLCKIYQIGTSVNGRKLLFAKLTNASSSNQSKPRIMLTSSMHGDEITGYVILLRMIDYLLTNYLGTKTNNLLDNYEIWINPLANPDGTYAGGNNTVFGATRYNANFIDLNRNFPDFVAGDHPDGQAWQIENLAMMHLSDSLHFVKSINFHGGAEVINYPWDSKLQRHPDDDWWQFISKKYADTIFQHCPAGYLTDVSANGYSNGSDWYIISGGRQDYMNYFNHCREFTMEISSVKTPEGSLLPELWEANYRSILNYIEEANQGFNGTVTDSITGIPLFANITITGHDADNSNVFSELPSGNFFRPVFAGNYNVIFSAQDYISKTVNINVLNSAVLQLHVKLVKTNLGINSNDFQNSLEIFPNPAIDIVYINPKQIVVENLKMNLFSMQGRKIVSNELNFFYTFFFKFDLSNIERGIYIMEIVINERKINRKIVLN